MIYTKSQTALAGNTRAGHGVHFSGHVGWYSDVNILRLGTVIISRKMTGNHVNTRWLKFAH
jgi:UDP-3-O-[3-hydroxymyristoyl] glucosamine N-acyltransferase